MHSASSFRDRDNLNRISSVRPGYYKWWADKDTFVFLLSKLDLNFDDIKKYVESKDNKYCIYIGIAVKESLQSRINWHVNQKHSESAVRNGTLSTLRQTISSLVAHDQYNEIATNNFIDKLYLEYFESPYEIKSEDAKESIHRIERDSMVRNLYILNIQENKHLKALPIIKKLKSIRKESK